MESKDAERQCDVTFDQSGYTVISDRAYGNALQPSDLDFTNLLIRKQMSAKNSRRLTEVIAMMSFYVNVRVLSFISQWISKILEFEALIISFQMASYYRTTGLTPSHSTTSLEST